MRVIIQPDYELASKWAAHYVAKKINDFGPTKTNPFLLGLPTGSSPLGMYKELIKLNSAKKVTFKNVITFNMDEYVGLPEDHPASYHYYMRNNFFNHIDIPAKNINILDGNAKNLEIECERYEEKMKRLGGVELFVGGVGPDGHIAFNEPGSSLASRTRAKTLTQDTIIANSRFFDDDVTKVPKTVLTVGVATVMDARETLIIASGHTKARALHHIIDQGVNHLWTVSVLQLHPRAIIVCDEDAAVELKYGTVKYFKAIESANLSPASLLK
jgi:glucosamine-6-phosphate deaminase